MIALKMKNWAISLLIVSIGILSACTPIHVRQSQDFSPLNTKRVAILVDFLSSDGNVVNLERSQRLGRKMADKISELLQKKGYGVSGNTILSVGAQLDGNAIVGPEKIAVAPPLDQPREFREHAELSKALVACFKEINRAVPFMEKDEGGPIDQIFPDIGQSAPTLNDYAQADNLLFVLIQERKKWTMKLVGALLTALSGGMGAAAPTALEKTEYFHPDPGLAFGVGAGVGFLLGSILSEDARPAGCAVLVDIKSGCAVWSGWTEGASGGASGDGVGSMAKYLLKKLPGR